jgi:DNA-binding transcriptional ArsR family regulator
MNEENASEELLNFFKALADANRLKIVGLLAQDDYSVEQLAELLKLHPSTVSHHLSRLSKAGLVSARADGYYSIYQLETKPLEEMAQRLLSREDLPAVAADVDLDAYDRKVLNSYIGPDGRLKSVPLQRKKLDVVLRYLARQFEPGVRYTEKQVNEIIARFNEDTAGLRRDMIDLGYLKRLSGGREYWREE